MERIIPVQAVRVLVDWLAKAVSECLIAFDDSEGVRYVLTNEVKEYAEK